MTDTLFEQLVDFGSVMRWHEYEVLEQCTPVELEEMLSKVVGASYLKPLGNGLFGLRGTHYRFSARPGRDRDGSYMYNERRVPHLDALLGAIVTDVREYVEGTVRDASKRGARSKPAKVFKGTWVGSRL